MTKIHSRSFYILTKLFTETLLLVIMLTANQEVFAQHSPNAFRQAKLHMVEIFRHLESPKTLYCGCDIVFPKRGGYMPDLRNCGYYSDKFAKNSKRIEAEHIMSAWEFGHNRSCWIKGNRQVCEHYDEEFKIIHSDLHNLYPSIGEVNHDRRNYYFSDSLSDNGYSEAFGHKRMLNYTHHKVFGYGKCQMVVDRQKNEVMPPQRARGIIARAYLYMSAKYKIGLKKEKLQLFQKWNKQYAPDKNECQRNLMIKKIQGNDNPFVSVACKLKH